MGPTAVGATADGFWVVVWPTQASGKTNARRKRTATAGDVETAHFIKQIFSIDIVDSFMVHDKQGRASAPRANLAQPAVILSARFRFAGAIAK